MADLFRKFKCWRPEDVLFGLSHHKGYWNKTVIMTASLPDLAILLAIATLWFPPCCDNFLDFHQCLCQSLLFSFSPTFLNSNCSFVFHPYQCTATILYFRWLCDHCELKKSLFSLVITLLPKPLNSVSQGCSKQYHFMKNNCKALAPTIFLIFLLL